MSPITVHRISLATALVCALASALAPANSASQGTIPARRVATLPRQQAGGILQSVPGGSAASPVARPRRTRTTYVDSTSTLGRIS
jgi:hypothetical protein